MDEDIDDPGAGLRNPFDRNIGGDDDRNELIHMSSISEGQQILSLRNMQNTLS